MLTKKSLITIIILLSISFNSYALPGGFLPGLLKWLGIDSAAQEVIVASNPLNGIVCLAFTEILDITGLTEEIIDSINALDENQEQVLIDFFEANNDRFCRTEDADKFLFDLFEARLKAEKEPILLMPDFAQDDIAVIGYDVEGERDAMVDALRHARLTAIFTRIFEHYDFDSNDSWGLKFMNAYEKDNPSVDPYPSIMDYHNNAVGKSTYQYLRDNGLGRTDDDINHALVNRCYTYVSKSKTGSEFQKAVDAIPGLVYFKKIGVEIEKKGSACPTPVIDQSLLFVNFYNSNLEPNNPEPSSDRVSLTAVKSSGEFLHYVWKFDKNVKYCLESVCQQVNKISSNSANAFVAGSSIYLLDSKLTEVTLSLENQYGDQSESVKAWINNWGPMVPIMNLLL